MELLKEITKAIENIFQQVIFNFMDIKMGDKLMF